MQIVFSRPARVGLHVPFAVVSFLPLHYMTVQYILFTIHFPDKKNAVVFFFFARSARVRL